MPTQKQFQDDETIREWSMKCVEVSTELSELKDEVRAMLLWYKTWGHLDPEMIRVLSEMVKEPEE